MNLNRSYIYELKVDTITRGRRHASKSNRGSPLHEMKPSSSSACASRSNRCFGFFFFFVHPSHACQSLVLLSKSQTGCLDKDMHIQPQHATAAQRVEHAAALIARLAWLLASHIFLHAGELHYHLVSGCFGLWTMCNQARTQVRYEKSSEQLIKGLFGTARPKRLHR